MRKSDLFIVERSCSNDTVNPEEEARRDKQVYEEERGNNNDAQKWERLLNTKLDLITEKARKEKKLRFTSLAHLLNEDFLAQSYHELKKRRVAGVDGVEVEEYGQHLEENLSRLVGKLKEKKYYPKPLKRAYIPKGDGKKRPLGIPSAEDRVVQMGIGRILEAIFETDFLGVPYGFRPGRSCHDALRKFDEVVMRKEVNWVIEVDIKGYFDHIHDREKVSDETESHACMATGNQESSSY